MFGRFKIGFTFGGFEGKTVNGTDGRDVLFGWFGDDVLNGAAGRDVLFGGFGDDSLNGGAGSDRLFGGHGLDTAVYDGGVEDYNVSYNQRGHGPIRASVTDAAGDTDRLHGIEQLYFAADDYTADLTGQNNVVLARDDTASSDATGATLAGLTDNDFDFDGDVLTITGIDTSGLTGSATLNDDGTISYATDGAFAGLAAGETAETTLSYTVSDGNGSTDTANVTITVTGENDAPVLTVENAEVVENTTEVTTASAFDIDGDTITYAISGDDAVLFSIDPATGVLVFNDAPDFEAPTDLDGDNVYDVTVTASDGDLSDSADIQITVTDEVEGPPTEYRINEIHYDSVGADIGEFIEVRVTKGGDVSALSLTTYNGSNGTSYANYSMPDAPTSSDDDYDYYVIPTPGLQNGSPDGIALSNLVTVIEFLSYEGTLTANDGVAVGLDSTDIGVSEPGSTPVGFSLQRNDDGTWREAEAETRGASNNVEPVVQINEFHYDNNGGDVGEFIEVSGTAGVDLTGWSLVLYNGSNGTPYNTITLAGVLADDADGVGFNVTDLPANGLQNGAPDGIALVDADGEVVEFLSYEGSLTAVGGPADGMTSIDIGASETSNQAIGGSIQKQPGGTWLTTETNTSGAENDAGSTGPIAITELAVNELHYDNAGTDVGEFVEVAGTPGGDLTGWTIALYNGSNGQQYGTLDLSGTLTTDPETGYATVAAPGIQNGSPDALALVDPNGTVVEFLSYEGILTAADGPAAGMTSTDIGIAQSSAPIGTSLQKQEDGSWLLLDETPGAVNDAVIPPPPPPAETTLIHDVQGAGPVAALEGQVVGVEAVVTATVSNGFYLQEEDFDVDADPLTSEGIFVFTGDTPNVEISATYQVTGTVSEFFGLTQISADTLSLIGLGTLPSVSNLTFPFSLSAELEAVEGMRVSVSSGSSNPLTVIETFNFDRFGEIVLSDGIQIQPTQIYDAQSQSAEIQALIAENAATRLIIDDGNTAQNPTSFGYIANDTAGDDGDGILSAGDDFTSDGPTLRIGAELDAPINGVVSYAFGDYRVIPTDTLSFDPATNEGARDSTAPDVGGDLKVVSFNALNYFTTLGERGANTPEDLARQTEKLVNALVELDGDVIGLQELENNGFGSGSAIAALVAAVNAQLGSEVYDYVDPTADGASIGTDAITNGFMYKLDAVDVINSDYLIFDDGDQQRNRPAIAATFEDANGERITIAVNHFKSKGPSGLTEGDPLNPDSDQGDGQGFWNETRTDAANQLTAWLATDPLGSGDPDFLILGDLNAYSQEDPVQAIETAGYDNLLEMFVGAEDAFSFVFNGQQGALDQALSSSSLTNQITGVEEWHINSLEPDLLSYNSTFTDAGFYNGDDVFSASDHDPLVLGLSLGTPIGDAMI